MAMQPTWRTFGFQDAFSDWFRRMAAAARSPATAGDVRDEIWEVEESRQRPRLGTSERRDWGGWQHRGIKTPVGPDGQPEEDGDVATKSGGVGARFYNGEG